MSEVRGCGSTQHPFLLQRHFFFYIFFSFIVICIEVLQCWKVQTPGHVNTLVICGHSYITGWSAVLAVLQYKRCLRAAVDTRALGVKWHWIELVKRMDRLQRGNLPCQGKSNHRWGADNSLSIAAAQLVNMFTALPVFWEKNRNCENRNCRIFTERCTVLLFSWPHVGSPGFQRRVPEIC